MTIYKLWVGPFPSHGDALHFECVTLAPVVPPPLSGLNRVLGRTSKCAELSSEHQLQTVTEVHEYREQYTTVVQMMQVEDADIVRSWEPQGFFGN